MRSNSQHMQLRKKWVDIQTSQRKSADHFVDRENSPTSSDHSTLLNIPDLYEQIYQHLESHQTIDHSDCHISVSNTNSDSDCITQVPKNDQPTSKIENTENTDEHVGVMQEEQKPLMPATFSASNSIPACCTEVSLDELSNATNAVNGSGGLPLLPTDIMISTGVSYTCIVGTKVSYDIIKACYEQERMLVQTLHDLDAMIEATGNSAEIQAMKYFVKHELKDVRHEKWVAGCVSGSSSALMTVSTFISAISPIAHFLATANGVGHMMNCIRIIHSTRIKLKRIQGNDEVSQSQQEHLKKELILHLKNLGSWTLFASGSAITGAVTLGALVAAVGGSISTGALPIVGISLMLPGIVGAFFFNNAATSKLYSPGLPPMLKEKLQRKELCTINEIQSNLARAQRNRLLAKEYRAHVSKHESLKSKIVVHALRAANKAELLVTLGLMPKTVMKNKRKIKEIATTLFHNSWDKRLDILSRVQKSAKSNATDISNHFADTVSMHAESDKLKFFLDTLSSEDKSAGAIGKLLARRVLQRKKQWSLPSQGADNRRTWLPKSTMVTKIVKRYETILHGGKNHGLDTEVCLQQLLHLSPCCAGDVEAKQLFQNLKKYYCDSSPVHQTPEFQEQKEALLTLLTQATDQYLVYQVRKEAKEEIALWTKYLSAFQKVEKNHSSLLPSTT